MKNITKRSILFILILGIFIAVLNIFIEVRQSKDTDYNSDIISKNEAKVLEIDNCKITNLYDRKDEDFKPKLKIKNISKLNLSQIVLYYDELDTNNKQISNSKVDIDTTLSSKEVMQVQFTPKNYTNTIEITKYTYITGDCSVSINLKNGEISILKNEKYLENSKNYEVMSIEKINNKKMQKNKNSAFTIKIKNISNKNLGNIVLKVAEINSNNEIVKIDHIIYNSILKPNEKASIASNLYDEDYDIKILGYTYDDMENMSNIDIDLITHKVNIVDDK